MSEKSIGIIGGSGLYQMEGLTVHREIEVDTPFGQPSDKLISGELAGKPVYFLARHGRGHRIPPHRLNYRANIFAFKQLGVESIVSVSAVGSMKEAIVPGQLVFPDQFIDWTTKRESTYFEDGIVAHVPFADPLCPCLRSHLNSVALQLGIPSHNGGTYLCIEGPQFSTRAESRLFRTFGVDVIGMTNVTEAKLAREAGICYATIALATDYDCWHETEEDVTADSVLRTLQSNVEKAKQLIKKAVADYKAAPCSCHRSLEFAVLTAPEAVSKEAKVRLSPILQKG